MPQDTVVVTDLARRGFVAVSNQLAQGVHPARAGDDIQAAVRWARAHRGTYGIDASRIIVLGPSGGAVAAMEVTFRPEDPGNSGYRRYSSKVAGGVSIGGLQHDPSAIGLGDPPIAMIHGLRDRTLPIAAAMATCAQTRALGNTCQFFVHENGGHPPTFVVDEHELIVAEISWFACRHVIGCKNMPPPPGTVLP